MITLARNYKEAKLKINNHDMQRIFTKEIPHVLVAGQSDEIFKVGQDLNMANLSVEYHHKNISITHESINLSTIAVLLVGTKNKADIKQGVLNIRDIDSRIPVIVLTKSELQSEAAKAYFAIGASDIIHSTKEIPFFQKYIIEHRKPSSTTQNKGLNKKEKRMSKAIITRIRTLTDLKSRISVSVKNKTAYITGKIRSIRRKEQLEEVALATPGVSNVVLTNIANTGSSAVSFQSYLW